MPTSNTASPVKRPGLGRRAVSSHAVVTRSTSTQSELANSNTAHQQSSKLSHRQPRTHVVGGGHRNHHRNPSFGKNLNKQLQRHLSHTQIDSERPARHHQRKKSAPTTPAAVTPATSPRGTHHVRWDGALGDSQQTTTSMKKNNSSPALRRNSSSVVGKVGKTALVTDRPHTSSGKKKTVGFELADSDDNDEGDWEDTTQSPESTRRSSVAQSKDSVENTAVLVDPLTFVKRSYPQFPRSTSLPESSLNNFGHNNPLPDDDSDDEPDEDGDTQQPLKTEDREEGSRATDHGDIASRLLSPAHAAKAPPAMSSISATAKPATVDSLSRNASLTNIASGHDGLRRPPLSSSQNAMANTPGNMTQATSSSIEGGVSRFIKTGFHATSRTDSDPNTPSSFLPHYHPQTPPSPGRGASSKRARASPPTRPPGAEPHSRTQQKLWLQRTAALNTSPPDGHGVAATASPSAMDPTFMAAAHARPGAGFDAGRGIVNGVSRAGPAYDNEAKHVRKAYEKTALELTVVRRFQSPTGDSFRRLASLVNDTKSGSSHQRHSSLGKPIKSAPALTLLQNGKQQSPSQNSASPEPKQLISRKRSDLKTSASQTYLQEPADLANEPADSSQRPKSQHPSPRVLSTSDEAAHPTPAGEEYPEEPSFMASEAELMIRRMWESREVAIAG
ncbi:hypothetical protein P875_00011086 [Aspergillus parasiticus SU-1]|uniref:Uncharacterized protein n=1 Tax=Aspergillus parasiticus (strain ATCC 56775 / NRRL 5862 / SRRC 143 / SU-1) TaxID=1403190 RepID=A0A0F0IAB3_ASPPU|nr:hypothetical protein P875_00011086 [Aspergillus parasiticus SU-1]